MYAISSLSRPLKVDAIYNYLTPTLDLHKQIHKTIFKHRLTQNEKKK